MLKLGKSKTPKSEKEKVFFFLEMEKKMIKLKSNIQKDQEGIEIDKVKICLASRTIEKLFVDDPNSTEVPLNIDITILAKIVELLQQKEMTLYWDVTSDLFMELLHATHYLDIGVIFSLCTNMLMQQVQGKTHDEIEKMFNVVITEEEREEAAKTLEF